MYDEYISIGEMAKINGISVATLRLYDEMGLLEPVYVNPQTNYRYYDITQNARLDLIQYMKELGMNLKEIKESLEKEDLTLIEAILIQKRKALELEVERKRRQKDALSRMIYSLERYRKSPKAGTITLEYISQRKIYIMKNDVNFYEYDVRTYENLLKKMKKQLLENDLPQLYYTNTGAFIKKDDFLQQRYISGDMFVFVDHHFPLKEAIRTIENSMFACIYLDDFDEEIAYAKKLHQYCMEHEYMIMGDYICEVLTELNFSDHNKRSMFYRLQVPIRFEK